VLGEFDSLAETVCFASDDPRVREHLQLRLTKTRVELRKAETPLGEPTTGMVRAAAAHLGDGSCRRLVAIGGGSVMDWARMGGIRRLGG
jgi:alcohol dehydrogenase class IV